MDIALIGYGKMGKAIEQVALHRGHAISARISSHQWDEKGLQSADICMEFTRPEVVVQNVQRLGPLKKNIVIGTTGWYDDLKEIRAVAETYQIGILYAPNFSIGIQLLLKILGYTSQMVNLFEEYDVAGIEYHHAQKRDSPSGTAREIAHVVEGEIPRVAPLRFSSLRCGMLYGTHTLLFDSPDDTITISHEAKNRDGFARGAVEAAEWLQGKRGLYTFADYFQEKIR